MEHSMTAAGSPSCCPRPRPASMRSKLNLRPTAGVRTVDRMCSSDPCSSRALESRQSILNTWEPESAGRPIDGGATRQLSAGK
eukprot:1375511-Alexandrium_andersonii.AAC.1